MRVRQLSFLPKVSLEHGGQTRPGRRKIARPIDLKRPLHLVLRSSMARGPHSMLAPKHEHRIRAIVDLAAEKYDIRLYRFVNVGNHLHLLVQTRTRPAFRGFLREISGRIAMLVTGSRKSHPLELITRSGARSTSGRKRFWDLLAYTRIVGWGRDFVSLKRYFIKNHFEAAGLLTREMTLQGARVLSTATLPTGPPRRPAAPSRVGPAAR